MTDRFGNDPSRSPGCVGSSASQCSGRKSPCTPLHQLIQWCRSHTDIPETLQSCSGLCQRHRFVKRSQALILMHQTRLGR